jgi:tRNA pseudouridine38-40 synthase
MALHYLDSVQGPSDTGERVKRIKGVLQYDGTAYRGWQRQADAPTVQEHCERALEKIVGSQVAVVASGRTDTGVHARGQVVHFDYDRDLGVGTLRRAWNSYLPEDIWVERLQQVPARFHSRHDALARTYRYFVALGPRANAPFTRRYAWPLERTLDWRRVDEATRQIVGTHDFRRFAKGDPAARGTKRDTGRCTVREARWRRTRNGKALEITADRFLRHMVRALVGALVAVGRERLEPAAIAAALSPSGERTPAAYAPPEGLFLWHVRYPRGFGPGNDR